MVAGRLSRGESNIEDAMLLTPPSTLRALSAGYRPVLHPSATELVASNALTRPSIPGSRRPDARRPAISHHSRCGGCVRFRARASRRAVDDAPCRH